MKKIFFILISSLIYSYTYAEAPRVTCEGLPGCKAVSDSGITSTTYTTGFISTFIGNFIQYIAAIAVIYLMIAGIMYLLSGGDDEKVKKAKKSIIWALVGVFISISAWAIIGIVNTFKIP